MKGDPALTSSHRLTAALLLTLLMTVTMAGSPTAAAATAADIYRAAKDSVVQVVTESGLGSGFFFDDGTLIVTNHHVIEGASDIRIRTSSGLEFGIARIVRTDATLDLAILAVAVKGRPLTIAPGVPEIGVDAFAIGSPQGLESTLSAGIISGLRHDGERQLLQFSAPISRGSSGGPVLDDTGRVVGVVGFLNTGGQNLNFAISAHDLMRMLTSSPQSPLLTISSGASRSGEVLPTTLIVDLGAHQRGAELSIWNASDCDVSSVRGKISFIPRPTKDAPVLYEEEFSLVGTVAPGERRSFWLPIDAVEGHSEAASLERRWYSRTTILDYARGCVTGP